MQQRAVQRHARAPAAATLLADPPHACNASVGGAIRLKRRLEALPRAPRQRQRPTVHNGAARAAHE